MQKAVLDKTLEELEGEGWGEPTLPTSPLVIKCHHLRRVPLREFTAGNLRIMIGQKIGLEYLVPLALKLLAANPFVEGDHFPGDLLKNVARLPQTFWKEHPDLQAQWQLFIPYAEAVERYLKEGSDFPVLLKGRSR